MCEQMKKYVRNIGQLKTQKDNCNDKNNGFSTILVDEWYLKHRDVTATEDEWLRSLFSIRIWNKPSKSKSWMKLRYPKWKRLQLHGMLKSWLDVRPLKEPYHSWYLIFRSSGEQVCNQITFISAHLFKEVRTTVGHAMHAPRSEGMILFLTVERTKANLAVLIFTVIQRRTARFLSRFRTRDMRNRSIPVHHSCCTQKTTWELD